MQNARETMTNTDTIDRIRERAYAIWQSEGCPEGCAEKHWSAAEEELLYSDAAPDRDTSIMPQPDASDAELQANAYGHAEAQPAKKRRRA